LAFVLVISDKFIVPIRVCLPNWIIIIEIRQLVLGRLELIIEVSSRHELSGVAGDRSSA
jgi:hypothetical protein